MLILGISMGVVAGLLVLWMMMNQQSQTALAAPTPEPPSVVRAAQNIAKGQEIRLDAVQLVRMKPGEPLPPGSIDDPMAVAGMTAGVDIPQGTIIQNGMFYDAEALAESGERVSMLIKPGLVAIAFPIGELSGVAGAVRPGDRVDIIASFELADVDPSLQARLPLDGGAVQLPRLTVQTILQNVEVLRVGGASPAQAQSGKDQPAPVPKNDVVTLLVPRQDALVAKFILDKMDEGQARITLALRSEDDEEITETEAVTFEYLMRRFKIPVPPKITVTTDTIQIKGSLQPR